MALLCWLLLASGTSAFTPDAIIPDNALAESSEHIISLQVANASNSSNVTKPSPSPSPKPQVTTEAPLVTFTMGPTVSTTEASTTTTTAVPTTTTTTKAPKPTTVRQSIRIIVPDDSNHRPGKPYAPPGDVYHNRVLLKWKHPAGASQPVKAYMVTMKEEQSGWSKAAVASVRAMDIVDEKYIANFVDIFDLKPSTRYQFRVAARYADEFLTPSEASNWVETWAQYPDEDPQNAILRKEPPSMPKAPAVKPIKIQKAVEMSTNRTTNFTANLTYTPMYRDTSRGY